MGILKDLVTKIQGIGYEFKIDGDNIKFIYTKGGKTPEEAIPIFKQFKNHKKAFIEYIRKAREPEPQPEQKPQQNRFTKVFDMHACKSKSKYDLNPGRKPCKRCGRLAERFCYDLDRTSRSPYCNWFCLGCEPYNDRKI